MHKLSFFLISVSILSKSHLNDLLHNFYFGKVVRMTRFSIFFHKSHSDDAFFFILFRTLSSIFFQNLFGLSYKFSLLKSTQITVLKNCIFFFENFNLYFYQEGHFLLCLLQNCVAKRHFCTPSSLRFGQKCTFQKKRYSDSLYNHIRLCHLRVMFTL